MRSCGFGVTIKPMSNVKRLYVALGTLLVAGIGGSLLTPLGVNEGVGAFSAGIAVGTLIAIYVLRVEEHRNMESVSTAHLNFHNLMFDSPSSQIRSREHWLPSRPND
jgi:hypothetical protein